MTNVLADEERVREAVHVLFVMEQFERMAERPGVDEICLTSVRFKLDADGGTSVLMILQGFKGDQDYVAFVGGLTAKQCMLAFRKKLAKNRLSWRESIPWGQ